jgi:hypothetical protein
MVEYGGAGEDEQCGIGDGMGWDGMGGCLRLIDGRWPANSQPLTNMTTPVSCGPSRGLVSLSNPRNPPPAAQLPSTV